jgi:hypothetical protein
MKCSRVVLFGDSDDETVDPGAAEAPVPAQAPADDGRDDRVPDLVPAAPTVIAHT